MTLIPLPPHRALESSEGWQANEGSGGLGVWDAGNDTAPIPPRPWLLGTSFCRGFLSSLQAAGGVGKSATRMAQLLSAASGRSLIGDYVFQRCRVLLVSLEDNADELRRRVEAACRHHGIDRADLRGWLYLSAPGLAAGKLAVMEDGKVVTSTLATALAQTVERLRIDIVSLDPFVKSHAVEENSNGAIDHVAQVLARLAIDHNCAVDVPHHTSKGPADAGNADRGRGASAFKDAARLVYTLAPMTPEEAAGFGIEERERRSLIRLDSAKVNIAPPAGEARWLRLVGVPLGNGSDLYPHGDEVQTVEAWTPPDTWAGISNTVANEILAKIDAGLPDGERYAASGTDGERAAWRSVVEIAPDKSEAHARRIIAAWVKNGVLVKQTYRSEIQRKNRTGLAVNPAKRPS